MKRNTYRNHQRPLFSVIPCAFSLIASNYFAMTPVFASVPAEAVKLCDQGLALDESKNFEQSIACFEQAVSLSPSYALALENLAKVHTYRAEQIEGDPAAALNEFDQSLFINPKAEKVVLQEARMIRWLGKNPNIAADRISLGDQALAAKHFRSAVVNYEAAQALDSATNSTELTIKLATALRQTGPHPGAGLTIDYASYMAGVQRKVKNNWHPPKGGSTNMLMVNFIIERDGSVHDIYLTATTDNPLLDQSVLTAVKEAAPMEPLPDGSTPNAMVNFRFGYNDHQHPPAETISALSPSEQKVFARRAEINCLRFENDELATKLSKANGSQIDRQHFIENCLKLAKLLSADKREDEAEKCLLQAKEKQDAEEAAAHTSSYPQTLNQLAEIYFFEKRYDQATDLLKQSIAVCEAQPTLGLNNQSRAYKLYGNLLLATHSEDYKKYWDLSRDTLNQMNPTIEELGKLIAQNSSDPTNYFRRADKLDNKKAYADAIADYTQAIKLNPKYAYAYTYRAYDYLQTKRLEEALSDAVKAIEIDPNFDAAYRVRADIYQKQKNTELALKDFSQAIKLDKFNFYNLLMRGTCNSQADKNEEALADFNQALRRRSDIPSIYCNRGIVYYHQKRYTEAKSDFTAALKLKPDYGLAYANRSCVESAEGKFEAALQDGELAVKFDPGLASAYINRGKAEYSLDQPDKALADLTQSIQIDPEILNGEAYYYRAKVYDKQGKADLAEADRKKADSLGFKSP